MPARMVNCALRTAILLCLIISPIHTYQAASAEEKTASDHPVPLKIVPGNTERSRRPVILTRKREVPIPRDTQPTGETPGRPHLRGKTKAVVSEAHYTAVAADESATISCRFIVQVFNGSSASVPLNFGEAAVGAVSVKKDRTPVLHGVGNGQYLLTVKGAGRHEISLELVAKVRVQSGQRRFAFSGPPAGISTLDVTVPGEKQRISVTPTFVPQAVKAKAGTSRVKGHLTAAARIAVAWKPLQSPRVAAGGLEAGDLPPVLSVENTTRLRLRDDVVGSESRLRFTVHRGRVGELRIVASAQQRILDVTAADKSPISWNVVKQPSRQLIHVGLPRETAKPPEILVHAERPFQEGTNSLAGFDEQGTPLGVHAADVSRETGLLIISHGPRWAVTIPRQRNWVPLDGEDVPAALRRPAADYVRSFQPKSPLAVRIDPVKPQISVDQQARFDLQPHRLTVTSLLRYRVGRIGITTASVHIPKGMAVERVSGNHIKSHAAETTDTGQMLQVRFTRRMRGEVELTVTAHRPLSGLEKPAEIPLPLPNAEQVDRESCRVFLTASPSLAVHADPAQTTGVKPVSVNTEPNDDGRRLVAAWSSPHAPASIVIHARRRPPRITAKVNTTVAVRESGAGVTSRIEFQVEHVPVRIFRFAAATELADALRVTDAAGRPLAARRIARETSPQEKADGKPEDETSVESGWSLFEVEATRPVLGAYRLAVAHELDQPVVGDDAATLRIMPLRVTGADLVTSDSEFRPPVEMRGEITIEPARLLQLTIQSSGGDVKRLSGHRFRYRRGPVSMEISARKLAVESLPQTVVSHGLIEVVLSDEPKATYRCRYRIRSSANQRLRLDLPKTSEPTVAFVDGKPVALERNPDAAETENWASYLVDVSQPQPADDRRSLFVQFSMPLEPVPFQVPLGRLRLNLPQIFSSNGNPAIVQEVRTVIWVPDAYALVGEPGNFSRRTATQLTGLGPGGVASGTDSAAMEEWIGVQTPEIIGFPMQGHAYRFDTVGSTAHLEVTTADMPFATWVLSVPLLFIGFVLAKTSLQNKVGIVLLFVFAGTIAAVSWGNETYHALLAARYGILGIGVWWTVHAGFARLRRKTNRRTISQHSTKPCPLPLGGVASVVIPPPERVVPRPVPSPATVHMQQMSGPREPTEQIRTAA